MGVPSLFLPTQVVVQHPQVPRHDGHPDKEGPHSGLQGNNTGGSEWNGVHERAGILREAHLHISVRQFKPMLTCLPHLSEQEVLRKWHHTFIHPHIHTTTLTCLPACSMASGRSSFSARKAIIPPTVTREGAIRHAAGHEDEAHGRSVQHVFGLRARDGQVGMGI